MTEERKHYDGHSSEWEENGVVHRAVISQDKSRWALVHPAGLYECCVPDPEHNNFAPVGWCRGWDALIEWLADGKTDHLEQKGSENYIECVPPAEMRARAKEELAEMVSEIVQGFGRR